MTPTSCATRSLCEWLKLTLALLILTLLTLTLQELKDDLLDDTAWPVVMLWFNEDHYRLLNRSSFRDTALTTGHDLSDH